MALGRCEWGSGTGNPHVHGMVYGAGNPVLTWEHEAMLDTEENEEATADGERAKGDGDVPAEGAAGGPQSAGA